MHNTFLPTIHGFHFRNSFPPVPDAIIRVPLLGHIPIGNAANGLCGGMIYAALDYYLAGKTIPALSTPPTHDDALFKYLFRRLWDSFDIPFGVMKYYTQMAHTGEQVSRSINRELPRIRYDLANGPVPVGLIRLHSLNPMNLGKNHQVLVYGITEHGGKTVLRIYDPNYADNDEVSIIYNEGRLAHSIDGVARGFFRTKYQARLPD